MKSFFLLTIALAAQPLAISAAPLDPPLNIIVKIPAPPAVRDTTTSDPVQDSEDISFAGTPICNPNINNMCTSVGAYCDGTGYHNKNWNPSCIAAPGVCWCD